MASIHGRTIHLILGLVREKYGRSDLAKERALAVSVLAFAGEEADIAWLRERCERDDSNWVRQNAKWALEMRRRDGRAHRLWEEIQQESKRVDAELLKITCLYERMEPLLLPPATLWPKGKPPSDKVHSLQLGFWYSWRNRGGAKAEREVAGRRLKEYCRGYKLRDEARRMAPWWKV
jgi:hypothetical protein